jgi:general secretion pathway protein G
MNSLEQRRIRNWKLEIKHSWQSRSGFTLIELIVVMAIIGILASVIMVNFIGVRARSRDGVRKSDLSQIRNALEIYRADVGTYPTTPTFPTCGSSLKNIDDPTIIYMQKIPCDPLGSADGYWYASDDGLTYTIIACLENTGDSQKDPDTYDKCKNSPFGASYTVTNP